ncbi:Protein C30G7.5 [Aphelenchoides avenae]|nr:Protein C30G7.5 [Aphelenchus avenae]
MTLALGCPVVIQFKINLVLTTAIAVDRIQAMCYPMYYRNKNHARYVAAVIVTGVSLGVLDVIIEFSLSTPVPEVLGCAAAGCFMSFKFRVYWGCSNMKNG